MIQEIDITFDRRAFESMYFRNYADSYVLGEKTKIRFIAVLSITIISPLITVSFHNSVASIMIGSWILFWILWIDYLMIIYKVSRWKKEIVRSLDNFSQSKLLSLELSEIGLVLRRDLEKTEANWETFTDAEVNDAYILLKGETDYFFPKSSMSSADFSILFQLVASKVRCNELDLLSEV